MEHSDEHPSVDADEPSDSSPKEQSSAEEQSKSSKTLHVVSVPNDQDMMAQEMAELFEEDQVTHQHGSSEPEGD